MRSWSSHFSELTTIVVHPQGKSSSNALIGRLKDVKTLHDQKIPVISKENKIDEYDIKY